MHYRTTQYRVYSQDKHISTDGEALSLFTIIPADAKMLQTYLIYYMIIGSLFFLWTLYIYILQFMSVMYFLASVL